MKINGTLSFLFMVILTANAGADETRTSRGADGQEHIFTRDTSVPALGEAWRDESGVIWGDLVVHRTSVVPERSIRVTLHSVAAAYCDRIGAQLPSRTDFERLSEYLGATAASDREGYTPQILPNLDRYYWASWVHPDGYSDSPFYFDGRTGIIYNDPKEYVEYFSTRCVARRPLILDLPGGTSI